MAALPEPEFEVGAQETHAALILQTGSGFRRAEVSSGKTPVMAMAIRRRSLTPARTAIPKVLFLAEGAVELVGEGFDQVGRR
jgi:hypothetical protein